MNKKIIKKLMLVSFVLILLLIIVIIGLKIWQKKEDVEIRKNEELIEMSNKIMSKQESSEKFFTVAQCISSYLDTLNTNNSNYFGKDENGEFVRVIEGENEKIYNLLSTKYIKENNITADKVSNFVPKVDEKLFFVPLKMEYKQSDQNNNLYQYKVYGQAMNLNYDKNYHLYLVVNIDFTNNTFSVEPQNQDINDIQKIELESINETIKQNDDNRFKYRTMNTELVVQTYMDYYKKMLLGNPQLAYDYLNEQYKEKRFGTFENFENYLAKNKEEIKTIAPNKYLVNNYEGYTQYVCQDQYENVYIFNEKSVMDFTIELDTYTIPTEKFVSTYQSAKEEKKVMMNVEKWIQMLNNRDYQSAYEVLDETYRNNTYGSQEQFELVIKQKLPLHYKVEYGENSEEKGTYVQKIIVTDITGRTEEKITISIIMQLKEDYNFVMSFSFTEEIEDTIDNE